MMAGRITPRSILASLDQADREWITGLASCRGCFTATDYAKRRRVSRRQALARLRTGKIAGLLTHVRVSNEPIYPHIYFLTRRAGRTCQERYQEPQNLHGFLDAMLRRLVDEGARGLVWKHNLRAPSVADSKEGDSIVVDCLDRAAKSVLQFAQSETGNRQVTIHTVSEIRAKNFQCMLGDHPTVPSSDEGNWDSFFSGAAPTVVPDSTGVAIAVVCHADHFKGVGLGWEVS